jgi:hypothetical protein
MRAERAVAAGRPDPEPRPSRPSCLDAHRHVQALPLPAQLAPSAKAAFEAHGQRLGIGFEVLPAGESARDRLADAPEPFFAVTLPSGETLLHRLKAKCAAHAAHA